MENKSKNKKVSFFTLGCKLNFSETSTLSRLFEDNGFEKVDFPNKADVCLINTCTVTQQAEKKCRQAIGKFVKNSPNSVVIVVGCYSQLKASSIAEIPGVNIVLGNEEKFNVLKHLNEYYISKQSQICSSAFEKTKDFNPAYSIDERTRSFLKVQDGCDYLCSYCTIPLARGNSRNHSIAKISLLAKEIASRGIKEIVLTGVNIGDFGKSTNEKFIDLLKELNNTEGIERFRISSIEPNLITKEIIEFVSTSNKFAPHFHIPLQSGCNKILKLMSRRYTRELFKEKINHILSIIPMAAIGIDIIVGFPGETDEDFEDTFSFLNQIPLAYLHVFSYSVRENTIAASLPEKVDPKKMNLRSNKLIKLSEEKRMEFYRKNINYKEKVLFESKSEEGKMYGFTGNYIKIETPFDKNLIGNTKEIILKDLTKSGVFLI